MLAKTGHMVKGIGEADFKELFFDIFAGNHIGIALSDVQGKVLQANDLFEQHFPESNQFSLIEITNSKPAKIIGPDAIQFELIAEPSILNLCRKIVSNPTGELFFIWTLVVKEIPKVDSQILFYRQFAENPFEWIMIVSDQDQMLFRNDLFLNDFVGSQYASNEMNPSSIFVRPEEYQLIKERVQSEKVVKHIELSLQGKNGEQYVGLANVQQSTNEMGVNATSWVILDITERKKFEVEFDAKAKQLEKANNQIEGFLYRASHDLRAPVTSIYGLINLLGIESSDPLVREYLTKMEQCTLKMDTIIKDMMSFSKTTYQRSVSERIDFHTKIQKVLHNHFGEENYDRIIFDVNIEGEFHFYSDPQRIDIILDNIVKNAIVFCDPAKLKSFVNIKVRTNMNNATIEIIDNGIGIARNHLSNIFNMFYRVSDKSKGSGLGLYIVKEAIHQLGATIHVESEVGFGSVFQISVPNDLKGKLANRKLLLERKGKRPE